MFDDSLKNCVTVQTKKYDRSFEAPLNVRPFLFAPCRNLISESNIWLFSYILMNASKDL